MTKSTIIVITIILLLFGSILFLYGNQISNAKPTVELYNARKEDLYVSQQKIEQQLSDLNQTLEAELKKQEVWTEKIVELSEKADLPPPVINTTKTIQEQPVYVTIPAPIATPTTRAS